MSPTLQLVFLISLALMLISIGLIIVAFGIKHFHPGTDVTDMLWGAVGCYLLSAGLGSFLPYPPCRRRTSWSDHDRAAIEATVREVGDGRYITRHMPREPVRRVNGDRSE